jgi:hypothetical protein
MSITADMRRAIQPTATKCDLFRPFHHRPAPLLSIRLRPVRHGMTDVEPSVCRQAMPHSRRRLKQKCHGSHFLAKS